MLLPMVGMMAYRGEHVDPRDDVPILATRVVHKENGVTHVIRPV